MLKAERIILAVLASGCCLAAHAAGPRAEVVHWWTSGGESAVSLGTAQNALRDAQFGAEAQAVGSRLNTAVGSYQIA